MHNNNDMPTGAPKTAPVTAADSATGVSIRSLPYFLSKSFIVLPTYQGLQTPCLLRLNLDRQLKACHRQAYACEYVDHGLKASQR